MVVCKLSSNFSLHFILIWLLYCQWMTRMCVPWDTSLPLLVAPLPLLVTPLPLLVVPLPLLVVSLPLLVVSLPLLVMPLPLLYMPSTPRATLQADLLPAPRRPPPWSMLPHHHSPCRPTTTTPFHPCQGSRGCPHAPSVSRPPHGTYMLASPYASPHADPPPFMHAACSSHHPPAHHHTS